MKFLIDTNIFIPLEPTTLSDVEVGTHKIVELARLVSEAQHQLYVHPAALSDIQRDSSEKRRKLREILFKKYPCLPDPPAISENLENILGYVKPDTNNWVDHCLIAALASDAIDFLVTEDSALRKKAARLNLHSRVATVAEATSIIQDLFDKVPRPPPAVRNIKVHALNENDPIFQSFRQDYHNFDEWLKKCKREHRPAWVIDASKDHLAAVCIIKPEQSGEFGLKGKILKICSLKVSEDCNGLRFGELLLKTIFDYATLNKYNWIYITVFEKHNVLIGFLEEFGFQITNDKTELGESILTKPMSFTEKERESMDSLPFNVRYGPSAIKFKGVPTFIIPIKPEYHILLFPEAEKQRELMPGMHPFGNSIRKAYLSNSVIRTITPGSNIFFYRSKDIRGITALGVVEDTLVSSSPLEIARHVGKRTVYRFDEIKALCQREVLAILFRQSRILKNPIAFKNLKVNGVLSSAPQSIITATKEAVEWLQTRLDI